MLPNTLNTNEIKNASGTEEEFSRISQNERSTEFALNAEQPAYPIRLKISHLETGSGISKRRRSVIRFDETFSGDIDTALPITSSAYIVTDLPIGNMSTTTHAKSVIARLLSFCASTGATTTILYDGSGNGAVTLLTGGL